MGSIAEGHGAIAVLLLIVVNAHRRTQVTDCSDPGTGFPPNMLLAGESEGV